METPGPRDGKTIMIDDKEMHSYITNSIKLGRRIRWSRGTVFASRSKVRGVQTQLRSMDFFRT